MHPVGRPHLRASAVAILVVMLAASGLPLVPDGAPGPQEAAPMETGAAAAPAAPDGVATSPLPGGAHDEPQGQPASLPTLLERNDGQFPDEVLWAARSWPGMVGLTRDGLLLWDAGVEPVRVRVEGGQGGAVEVVEGMASHTRFILDVGGERVDIDAPHARHVRLHGILDGVDLDLYVRPDGAVEHDFILEAGIDPASIRFEVDAPASIEDGALLLGDDGAFRLEPPQAYQDLPDGRHLVDAAFETPGPGGSTGFHIGAYDPLRPLVIDPVVSYGTYLPHSSDNAYFHDVARTTDGGYVAVGRINGAYTGPLLDTEGPTGGWDAFAVRWDETTNELQYVLVYGSISSEYGYGIAAGPGGDILIAGSTASSVPMVAGSGRAGPGGWDGFVARFETTGCPSACDLSLTFATHFGGASVDYGMAVAVGPTGHYAVTGTTARPMDQGFQTVNSPPQNTAPGTSYAVFVALLDPSNSEEYVTIMGGSGVDAGAAVAVDGSRGVYVVGATTSGSAAATSAVALPATENALQEEHKGGTGYDGFVAKFAPDASYEYVSYYGAGSGNDFLSGLHVAAPDDVWVVGSAATCCMARSDPRPIAGGLGGSDATVGRIRITPAQTDVLYGTHLGGNWDDYGHDVVVDDATGRIYVIGRAESASSTIEGMERPFPRPWASWTGASNDPRAIVWLIDPAASDPGASSTAQAAQIKWATHLDSNAVDSTGLFNSANPIAGALLANGDLVVAVERATAAWASRGHVTPDAIATTVTGTTDAALVRLAKAPPQVIINATPDGGASVLTPPAGNTTLDVPTFTDVTVNGSLSSRGDELVNETSYEWDLDGDGVFDDGTGNGSFVVVRDDGNVTVPVCLRAKDLDSVPSRVAWGTACVDITWRNRAPAAVPEVVTPAPLHRGAPIAFSGTSSSDLDGTVEAYAWDFGGPGTADLSDPAAPTFTYSDTGTYEVRLDVTDDDGAEGSATVEVEILNAPPVPSCVAPVDAIYGDPVMFDLSASADPDGAVASWSLEPGMGLPTKSGSGPPGTVELTAGYPSPGTAEAVVKVTDNNGASEECTMDVLVDADHLVANIIPPDPPVYATAPVQFADGSFGPDERVAWQWDFGDGATSSEENPVHTFAAPGTYQVSLTASTDTETDSTVRQVTVVEGPDGPVPDFEVRGTPPWLPAQNLHFMDRSALGVTQIESYEWDFAGLATAGGPSPRFAFPSPGSYDVTLTLWDDLDRPFSVTKAVTIEAYDHPAIDFRIMPDRAVVGQEVVLKDMSTAGTRAFVAREWTVAGHQLRDAGAEVTYVFDRPGRHTVTMVLEEAGGRRHAVDHVVVVDPAPAPKGPPQHAPMIVDPPVAHAGFDHIVLQGTVARLDGTASASVPAGRPLEYTWRQVDGHPVDLLWADTATPMFAVPWNGIDGSELVFELVVDDGEHTSDPDLVRLVVRITGRPSLPPVGPPAAAFTQEVRRDGTVRFEAAEQDLPDVVYRWDFGDGTTDTGRDPVHHYAEPGAYRVNLTVEDAFGRSGSQSGRVEVVEPEPPARPQRVSMPPSDGGGGGAGIVVAAALVLGLTTVGCSAFLFWTVWRRRA